VDLIYFGIKTWLGWADCEGYIFYEVCFYWLDYFVGVWEVYEVIIGFCYLGVSGVIFVWEICDFGDCSEDEGYFEG
jgi:hypothetical protein